MAKPLGRRVSKNFEHVEKYPLMAAQIPELITAPTPIVIGINWYSNFDDPVLDSNGHYWIGQGKLGSIRGGHCVCLKPRAIPRRPDGAWRFYDQGSEGACVGFGTSQMMSILNEKFYFARWLWDRAKEIDYWDDTNPGDDSGTSVKAALDVLRIQGHIGWSDTYDSMNTDGQASDWVARAKLAPVSSEGISANRWITSMDDCMRVLGYSDKDYVDVMNSWGRDYPRLVRMPLTALTRLWKEDGEFGVVTDR